MLKSTRINTLLRGGCHFRQKGEHIHKDLHFEGRIWAPRLFAIHCNSSLAVVVWSFLFPPSERGKGTWTSHTDSCQIMMVQLHSDIKGTQSVELFFFLQSLLFSLASNTGMKASRELSVTLKHAITGVGHLYSTVTLPNYDAQ